MSVVQYVVGIVSASVAISLIRVLVADESGGVKRTLSYVLSLAMVCAVMLPLGGLLSDFLEQIENGKYEIDCEQGEQGDLSSLIEEAERISADELAEELERRVRENFSLPEGSVEIVLSLDFGEDVTINTLTVFLSGKAMWEDPHAIKKFIYDITEFECEVVT